MPGGTIIVRTTDERGWLKNYMKKIAVTGGKGGVGKSTVAVLLSRWLAKKGSVVLADCDVEAPNDHLLLGVDLSQPDSFSWGQVAQVEEKKCQQCGLCAQHCPENAILAPKGKLPIIYEDLCSGCRACRLVCPHEAISMKKVKRGEIFINEIESNLTLVTGRAQETLEETVIVVQDTKRKAEKKEADYLIVDTMPGLHCGVIRALWEMDLVLAVTEPTPLGEHDLELILELTKQMDLAAKVILNRADLGDKDGIEKIAAQFDTSVVLEIPYDKKIIESSSRGKLDYDWQPKSPGQLLSF